MYAPGSDHQYYHAGSPAVYQHQEMSADYPIQQQYGESGVVEAGYGEVGVDEAGYGEVGVGEAFEGGESAAQYCEPAQENAKMMPDQYTAGMQYDASESDIDMISRAAYPAAQQLSLGTDGDFFTAEIREQEIRELTSEK